jgi:hypothetical protein
VNATLVAGDADARRVNPIARRATLRYGFFDRANEPIPMSTESFNVLRGVRVVMERPAKPFYGRVETVLEIDECVGGPKAAAQFFAGDG